MLTIFKFQLQVTDTQVLTVPAGATPICVQTQNGEPCIWMKVLNEEAHRKMVIFIHGTGHQITSPSAKYLDTFQMREGALVFHVFWEWVNEDPTP